MTDNTVIAVIGTAGRKADADHLTKASYDRMLKATMTIIEKEFPNQKNKLKLVSGGAAWADHLVVSLGLMGYIPCDRIELYTPSEFNGFQYIGNDNISLKTSQTSNFYHRRFSEVIGRDSLKEINTFRENGGILIPGKGNFFDRNTKVASAVPSDGLGIAFTFGMGDFNQGDWSGRKHHPGTLAYYAGLKPGGTAHTWDLLKCPKYHVRLGE